MYTLYKEKYVKRSFFKNIKFDSVALAFLYGSYVDAEIMLYFVNLFCS